METVRGLVDSDEWFGERSIDTVGDVEISPKQSVVALYRKDRIVDSNCPDGSRARHRLYVDVMGDCSLEGRAKQKMRLRVVGGWFSALCGLIVNLGVAEEARGLGNG